MAVAGGFDTERHTEFLAAQVADALRCECQIEVVVRRAQGRYGIAHIHRFTLVDHYHFELRRVVLAEQSGKQRAEVLGVVLGIDQYRHGRISAVRNFWALVVGTVARHSHLADAEKIYQSRCGDGCSEKSR